MECDVANDESRQLRGVNSKLNNGCTAAYVLALVVMCAYLFMASRSTLWDRDEPRFARATVEMIESGNYLIPSFNGEMWLDKPVFTYWAMSLPVRLLGPTEFAFFGLWNRAADYGRRRYPL